MSLDHTDGSLPPPTDEERYRRWYVCPFIECHDDVVEQDARKPAPTCEEHGARKRIMFADRLAP